MNHIPLKNGCHYSELSVHPKNWQKAKEITGPWRISYRFYDPSQPKPKQVVIKSMNAYKDLKKRREVTRELLDYEKHLLQNEGYNPFSKKVSEQVAQDITPNTPFIKALELALPRLKAKPKTKQDIRNILIPFAKAATQLYIDTLPLKEIRKRHIKFCLEQVAKNRPRFTANTFNHYRTYLSMLFVELEDLEAVEMNPIIAIKKEKTIKKQRKTLSEKEREKVREHLKQYPAFNRYVQIFFHSGARTSELLLVKALQVDLQKQRYLCTIEKGKQAREEYRTIKDIALPYWKELLSEANPDDYIFSKGLKPGANPIRPDQITKRWTRLVMEPLKIKATFYSLKHLNTKEMVDSLDEQAAAKLNAHQDTGMVIKIYDIGRDDRQHKRIKNVNNPF